MHIINKAIVVWVLDLKLGLRAGWAIKVYNVVDLQPNNCLVVVVVVVVVVVAVEL